MILYQEVDIVETVHQTMLLIAVDIEMLLTACSLVGHRLLRQIDLYLCLRIGLDALEQLSEETFADLYRQYEIVQFVVLVQYRAPSKAILGYRGIGS